MLNEAQQIAVDATESRIVCLAGAGVGKSTVLLSRISRLIKSGVDPTSILALTFTNAAAFEMKDRFTSANSCTTCPEFRTFHSFCYHLISTDAGVLKSIGYHAVPSVASEHMERRIIKEAKLQTGIKLSDKKIFEKQLLSQTEAHDLLVLYKAVDRLMKQKSLITFDMMCKSVCDLFVNDAPCIQKYKQQFKYVFCDEYQDTDSKQHEFIMSFKHSSIFVVGDALQQIYSFRGTSSEMIKNLAEDSEWRVIKLYENYRSTIPICNYANKYSKSYAKESYRIAIQSTQDGPPVAVRDYSLGYKGSVSDEILDNIIAECAQLPGTSAILVRTNAEVAAIQEYLRAHNVPFMSKFSDINSHNILRSVLDDQYAVEWLATFLSSELYSEYIRRSVINSKYSLYEFINEFSSNRDICTSASKIYELRKICRNSSNLASKQRSMMKVLGYDVKLNVDKSQIKTLSDLLNSLACQLEQYSANACNLYVGTVHSVKGLEYDNVYVVGPRGRSWPLTTEDNSNLFYVAITRAKSHLFIYFAH